MLSANASRRPEGDQILAGLIAVAFVAMVLAAVTYPAEPRLLPSIIGVAGVILAAAVVLGFGRKGEAAGTAMPRMPRLALALFAPPLYAASLWLLGHWVTNLVAIPTIALLLGYWRLSADEFRLLFDTSSTADLCGDLRNLRRPSVRACSNILSAAGAISPARCERQRYGEIPR